MTTLQIGPGISVGAGITFTSEASGGGGGGGGGGTTFTDSSGDFGAWILGDGDGSGYIRFQGLFNPNDFSNGPLGLSFFNYTDPNNLTSGTAFSVVAVVSGTTYNLSATVDHIQVHEFNQVDMYYNTVSGDLPFNYGGDSLSITFA